MTASTDHSFAARRAGDIRLITGVSAAHFMSHYYMLVLPPLFAFVRQDYGVSYTELGLALTMFNATSAVLQTPAGFMVDRVNARLLLIGGLVLQAAALAVAGLVNSYWVMIAMFALMGVGNTVYHPADYSLLSRHVATERVSQAYSIHTFSGLLGSAAAPGTILFMHSLFGWRGAFIGAGILGLVIAIGVLLQGEPAYEEQPAKQKADEKSGADWKLLLSSPILVSFVFFMLLAFSNFGLQNFSVVALGTLYGTAPSTANTALSANLAFAAVGVLAGGWIAARTRHHALAAALGLLGATSVTLLLGTVDVGAIALILVMAFSGFCTGAIMSPRDMLVREVTPPGSFGTVFGFVTNGFSVAGILSPLVFGALMDHGEPRLVFFVIAAGSLLGILTVASVPRRRAG
ncbi:MAG: MFS transporter [Pseudomonadota bacterium]